jgi:threonine/homoserine/homoserine lactone efflux protein
MLEYVLIGSGFALAAGIQPGPFQAFLLNSVARNGWKATLPASFSPLISDVPIALLALFVLNQIAYGMTRILRGAGGVFLIYLAWTSYRQWKRGTMKESETSDSAPRTILQAATVNILNPNPYLGWSLVLGPAFMAAWNQGPQNAVALIIAFYATMILVLACTILLFGTTRVFGRENRRILVLASAVLLAVFGVYQIVMSLLGAVAA